jgi:hypothetical protein
MQPKFLVWKIGWAIVSLSEIEGMCGKNKKLWYIIFLRLLKCPCTNRGGNTCRVLGTSRDRNVHMGAVSFQRDLKSRTRSDHKENQRECKREESSKETKRNNH